MQVLLTITLVLVVLYALLMIIYSYGWRKTIPETQIVEATNTISVIISARNEAENIEACLASIMAQTYPTTLWEVIVVDDFSEDETSSKVLSYAKHHNNIRLIQLKDHINERNEIRSYKKIALQTGIAHAKGALIITTDADCIVTPDWLQAIASKQQATGAKMIVSPVDFMHHNSLVALFQSLDFMTMQGITAAAWRLGLGNMCNGANLAFLKTAFDAVDGYKGVDHLASGDDYLLMVKIKKQFPNGIAYLKSQKAIVRTTPQPNWYSFIQQRIRWASKSGKYDDWRLTSILVFVYFVNLTMLSSIIGCMVTCQLWDWLIIAFAIKLIAEIYFLLPVAQFFNKKRALIIFPFLQILHIIYIVSAGFLGLKGNFVWKGRKVK